MECRVEHDVGLPRRRLHVAVLLLACRCDGTAWLLVESWRALIERDEMACDPSLFDGMATERWMLTHAFSLGGGRERDVEWSFR